MKNLKSLIVAASFTAAAFTITGCKTAHDHDHSGHSHGAAKPYPLQKCIVTDEAFGDAKPVAFVHEGQEIKVCCDDCRTDFAKEPAKYLKKLAQTK